MQFSFKLLVFLSLFFFPIFIFIFDLFFIENDYQPNPFLNFIKKCNDTTNYLNITKISKINIGWILWKKLDKLSLKHRCKVIYKLYNVHTIQNEFIFNRLYHYNNKYSKNVSGKFVHHSYYRISPKNKNNFENVISHTYIVQEYIFKHQNPINCENRSFLIIGGFDTGHGSEIHVIGTYLALALTVNRIAILDPFYKNKKSFGSFCGNITTWECFFEPLTNCSIPNNAFINTTEYQNTSQTEKYLYIKKLFDFINYVPPQINKILASGIIPNENLLPYWRIQSTTYIFRLNEKTNNKVNELIKESLGNTLQSGCVNVWVRHGDKYKEMQLLTADKYMHSVKFINSISNNKFPVYISSDDPEVITYYQKYYSNELLYLKFKRLNDNYTENLNKGDKMTLNFIADVKAALHCIAFSGTRQSNVVRIIDELKNTVGFSLNYPYFENGYICINEDGYEKKEFW